MNWCWLRLRTVLGLAALLSVSLLPAAASAQFGGIGGGIGGVGGGIGGIGGGIGGIGGGGVGGQQQAGVRIDAQGVLKVQMERDPGNLKLRRNVEMARKTLDPKLATASESRKISLNRLEQALAAKLSGWGTDSGRDEVSGRNAAGPERVLLSRDG